MKSAATILQRIEHISRRRASANDAQRDIGTLSPQNWLDLTGEEANPSLFVG